MQVGVIFSIYRISLKLKTPSEEGKNLNFKDLSNSLMEATHEFNDKYRSWSKRLILDTIEAKFFNVLLIIEKNKEKISTREIRSFTAYLNKVKNWSVYSRDKSKLFEGARFVKVSLKEAKEIVEEIPKESHLYESQKDDIHFLNGTKEQEEPRIIHYEKVQQIHPELSHDISDEQAMAIFKYLLKTKDLGQHHREKKEAVLQIKDMLIKWL